MMCAVCVSTNCVRVQAYHQVCICNEYVLRQSDPPPLPPYRYGLPVRVPERCVGDMEAVMKKMSVDKKNTRGQIKVRC